MRETLQCARELLADRIALAHFDPGTGDFAASRALAAELAPLIPPLLRPGGMLASEPAIAVAGLGSDAAAAGDLARPLPPLPARQLPIVSMTGTWSEALSQPRLSR